MWVFASDFDSALIRLNPDGSTDTGFASSGLFMQKLSTQDEAIRDVVVLSSGKILAGSADEATGNMNIMRLTFAGAFDPTFGSGGLVSTAFTKSVFFRKLFVQSDVELYGMEFPAPIAGLQPSPYSESGVFDTSYRNGGKIVGASFRQDLLGQCGFYQWNRLNRRYLGQDGLFHGWGVCVGSGERTRWCALVLRLFRRTRERVAEHEHHFLKDSVAHSLKSVICSGTRRRNFAYPLGHQIERSLRPVVALQISVQNPSRNTFRRPPTGKG